MATITTSFALSPLAMIHGMPAALALPAIPDGSTLTEVQDAISGSSASCNDCLIRGNTHNSQGHLFHSFSELNVPTGATLTFDNVALDGTSLSRIFSRVTGPDATTISGELEVLGGADLFLLNPQGLIIGPGAVLNIGGSFVGSTAEAIAFSNGSSFSTQNPSISPPLLAINTPIGLQFGSTVAPVEVQSAEINFPGRTLALAGAEAIAPGPISGGQATGLRIQNSNVFLTSGGLELASLAPQEFLNFVDTTTGIAFVFPTLADLRFGNLSLQNSSIQALNLANGGDTALYGDVVGIVDSNLYLESDGTGPLGQIFVAAQQLTLNNSVLRTVNSLTGGEITLQNHSPDTTQNSPNPTPFMALRNGEISSTTIGDGGDIFITTFGDLLLNDRSEIVTQAETGAAGDIDIILSSTNLFFFGQAGTLALDQSSRISTSTPSEGGNIAIGSSVSSLLSGGNSGKLTLSNGSYISAVSNPGNTQGGRISIPSNALVASSFESVTSQGLSQDNDIFVVGSVVPPLLGVTPSGFDVTGMVTRGNGRSEIGIADAAPADFTSRFTPFAPSIPLPPALPPVVPPPPTNPTPPTDTAAEAQQPTSAESPVNLLALNGLALPTTVVGITPVTFSPEAVAIASNEGTVVLDEGNLTLINPSGSETFEVTAVETGLFQELPLSENQKKTIAAALVVTQQQENGSDNNEQQKITAVGSQGNSTASWVRPGCPLGEEANFAGLNVLGLGGIPAAPSSLTSNPKIWVDLGSADADLAHQPLADQSFAYQSLHRPAPTPNRPLAPETAPIREAIGWEMNITEGVRLMTAQEAIARRPSSSFTSPHALALESLRLNCFPS